MFQLSSIVNILGYTFSHLWTTLWLTTTQKHGTELKQIWTGGLAFPTLFRPVSLWPKWIFYPEFILFSLSLTVNYWNKIHSNMSVYLEYKMPTLQRGTGDGGLQCPILSSIFGHLCFDCYWYGVTLMPLFPGIIQKNILSHLIQTWSTGESQCKISFKWDTEIRICSLEGDFILSLE